MSGKISNLMKQIIILICVSLWSIIGYAAPSANTQYFSNDGNVLIHIDLQRLQKGKTPQKLLGLMMTNPSFKQKLNRFKSQFGVDPFKDLRSLTMNIKLTETGRDPEILMHIQGTFNQEQFIKGLVQEGNVFERETIKDHVAHISAANKSALSFVSDGVIMGTPTRLRSALQGVSFGGHLAEQQAKMSDGGDLWFTAYVPDELRAGMNPAISDSRGIRGYLDFARGLHLMMITEFTSTETAAHVVARLNQAVAQAKQSPQAAMFMSMINKLSIKAEGTVTTIDLPLSQEDMDQIQAILSMVLMSLSMNQPEQATQKKPSFPRLDQPTAKPSVVSPTSPAAQPVKPSAPSAPIAPVPQPTP